MPQRVLSAREMRQHVHDLADAFRVAVVEDVHISISDSLMAKIGEATIVFIAPVRDELTYAVALHELGHAAAPNGTCCNVVNASKQLRQTAELAAWEWAQYVALDWSPTMEHARRVALKTYGWEEA